MFSVYAIEFNSTREFFVNSYDRFSSALMVARDLSNRGYSTEIFHENDLRVKFPAK